jgi:hypothetical protein
VWKIELSAESRMKSTVILFLKHIKLNKKNGIILFEENIELNVIEQFCLRPYQNRIILSRTINIKVIHNDKCRISCFQNELWRWWSVFRQERNLLIFSHLSRSTQTSTSRKFPHRSLRRDGCIATLISWAFQSWSICQIET